MDISSGNNATRDETPQAVESSLTPRRPAAQLSRRDILVNALRGASCLAALALLPFDSHAQPRTRLERLLPGVRELTGLGGPGGQLQGGAVAPRGPMQLPFWGDAANWNRPEYYETIQAGRRRFPRMVQSADVDGDGQDELIARGPGGVLVQRFDPDSGQWLDLIGTAPPWSDANGWNQPEYYQTIQTADIDGDGRAELLARDASGIEAWKYTPGIGWSRLPDGPRWGDGQKGAWNRPEYYSTIQCADIDGDGQAELIGRAPDDFPGGGGIIAYKYTTSAGWVQLPFSQGDPWPAWADYKGWNRPQFYETIQCADMLLPGDPDYSGDGVHAQAVLLARDASDLSIHTYKFTTGVGWSQLAAIPSFSGWSSPEYYSTIQCADIDNDGRAELLGRAIGGIIAYKYAAGAGWIPLSGIPSFSDDEGWNQPQYYETIQCADIDGDGRAELLGRAIGGIIAYKYTTGDVWTPLDLGIPEWSDAAGWNASQYYGTIQTARVKGAPANPNNPLIPGDKPVAALIGRSASAIETWRCDAVGRNWARTSAPWPQFTGDKLTAYNYLTAYFGLVGGGVRSHYDDNVPGDLAEWASALYSPAPGRYDQTPRPAPALAAPAGVSLADWADITWQLYWEITFVLLLHDWYGTKINSVIQATFQSKKMNLDVVNSYINLPSDSSTTMALNIFALLFNVAWAVAGAFDPIAAKIAGVIAGILSTAFEAATDYVPGDGSTQATYAELGEKLTNAFNNTLLANGRTQLAITGGGVDPISKQYQTGDWGLLCAIGKQIKDTAWTWPSTQEAMVVAAQRQYAIDVWGPLIIAKGWGVTYSTFLLPPGGYPSQYRYIADQTYWLYVSHWRDFPAVGSLQALFDKPQTQGDVFPLNVPLADVFTGQNGWPKLDGSNSVGATAPPPPKRPSFGPDLQISKLALRREPTTGEIVATFRLSNHGLRGTSNVTLTAAQMGSKKAIAGVPSRHKHLGAHRSQRMTVRFPGSTGAAGGSVVLRLSGAHLGGSFGGSFRVKLP